ncbi:hypothetical protein ACFFUB_09325 [Algimonas porphyrae]|uniref:Uncharacterized protein n=1 Tax=Algimonas porphyrae TaxID=1128113 RepID=A0ABQ5V3M6_9PROT|nr:hypothetical protein [Algimonas porphyrae]GLQ21685.1 hypothetical protein GCM10007854_26400 [Algimonas porphyrae]
MLFRRIKAHVENENWFAVGVDFLIVVVGVFIGIQVANWNEEQSRKAQEHSYLILVHEELVQNAERADRLLDYYTKVTDAGERALVFLKSDDTCEANCEDLLIDFFHASQLWTVIFDQTAFREAVELGFPSDNALREELFTTYDLTSSFRVINQMSPPFRETVREYIEPGAARILWSGCWEVDVADVTETLTRGCEEQLKTVDSARMLRDIKSNPRLEGMLRYWLNQNIFAMINYPTVRDRTIATADMVATEIERVR